MATNIQPLRPYVIFTQENGTLTPTGYDFLYNMFLRVGGSLDSLNAVTLADKTWDAPNPIGSTTPSTGAFTTLTATTSANFSPTGQVVINPTTASNMNNMTIGGTTPKAATFTTLTVNTSASFAPSGTVTINPTTASAMDNVTIGGTTPKASTFTTMTTTTGAVIGGGVAANGSGLKHARLTTGSILAGTDALVTHTWATTFADANYTVSASVVDATTAAASLRVVHIETISATQVAVRVENTSAGNLTGTLHLIAIHD